MPLSTDVARSAATLIAGKGGAKVNPSAAGGKGIVLTEGVVASYNSSTGVVGVYINGNTTSAIPTQYLSSPPTVGTRVVMLEQGRTRYIIGTKGTATSTITWTTPTLNSGWTTSASYKAPRYFIDGLGMVHLDGYANYAGTLTSGVDFVIFTVVNAAIPPLGVGFSTSPNVYVTTNGSVKLIGTGQTGQSVFLSGLSYPTN